MFIEAYDEKKLKLCEFVKRVGGHNIHTPFELTEKVVNTIEADEKAKVAVLFNIEFVFTLIALKGIDPKKITFFGDCPKKRQLVESWGLKVIIGDHVFNQNNHFSGTDEERTSDFQNALDNPSIKAIWCARGGYGSGRILDNLVYDKFKGTPKWIIGYSDITAFHSHIHNLGIQTIHAMMGTSLLFDSEKTKQSIETLRKALFGDVLTYKINSSKYNKEGVAEGVLVGGNLSILQSMLGSESQLNTDGTILFIEEIGEYKYHVDRMLQSLKRAGYFDNCKGLIVGDMSNIKKNTTAWGSSIEQLILDVIEEFDFPVLFNFPAGHEPDNRALVFGEKIKMNITSTTSEIIFK